VEPLVGVVFCGVGWRPFGPRVEELLTLVDSSGPCVGETNETGVRVVVLTRNGTSVSVHESLVGGRKVLVKVFGSFPGDDVCGLGFQPRGVLPEWWFGGKKRPSFKKVSPRVTQAADGVFGGVLLREKTVEEEIVTDGRVERVGWVLKCVKCGVNGTDGPPKTHALGPTGRLGASSRGLFDVAEPQTTQDVSRGNEVWMVLGSGVAGDAVSVVKDEGHGGVGKGSFDSFV